MFKKVFLSATLLVFSLPNISYTQGDECDDCMQQAAMAICLGCSFCLIMAAECNKPLPITKLPNQLPRPQKMGDEQNTVPKDKNA